MPYLVIILLAGIFFLPFLGHVHLFDWDELNFAEMSREMMVTGDYFKVQVDFRPFYEKPPLFMWIQNLSFALWGVNEFGARFPNVIVAMCCLLVLYKVGTTIRDQLLGTLWVLCYCAGLLPFMFFKTGLIDPLFNLLIFTSLVLYLVEASKSERHWYKYVLAGAVNGMAILAKGPVAFLILALTVAVYAILSKKRAVLFKPLVWTSAGAFIVSSIWFVPETVMRGPEFILEFVSYMLGLLSQNIASHEQPFYYHFLVLFFGCFPISIFALSNIWRTTPEKSDFNRWMVVLFWVVLILFSLVRTKIVNYSSLTYYPLSYLSAFSLYQYHHHGQMKRSWFFLIMGIMLCLPVLGLPILTQSNELMRTLLGTDQFTRESMETFELPIWTIIIGFVWLIGIVGCFFLIRKGRIVTGLFVYTICLAVMLNASLYWIVPQIEQTTQGPSIKYFKQLKDQPVYLGTIGFKSYGKYFYAERTPAISGYTDHQLLTDFTDRDTYLVVKPHKLKLMQAYPAFQLLENEGGFYLFYRPKSGE